MSGFGQRMKAAREARGVTLEEMCAATRIGVRLLEAIENEQFGLLPGGVFSVSFVRQYASFVELEEEMVVEEFKTIAAAREPVLATMERTRRGIVGDEPDELAGARIAETVTEYFREHGQTLAGGFAVLIITVATVWYFQTERAWQDPVLEDSQPAAVTAAKNYDRQSEYRKIAQPPPLEEPAKPLNVVLTTTREVWIRALADGRRVFERTFEPGQRQKIEAENAVRLRVGNAGGLDVKLNGRSLEPIGPLGHVREVVITTDGMEVLESGMSARSAGDVARSDNGKPDSGATQPASRRLAHAEP